jgi:multidrug efflux pump subunit AcrA (membrane-fusion protein)
MLTVPVDGTVKEVYVKQGDQVEVGDFLYDLDTESIEENIAELESTIADYESQLSELNENVSSLTVSAPFTGKLTNVTVNDGDEVSGNTMLATLVDDSKMQLDLYFSVAYKGSISKGMQADVSIPQYMAELKGTVTAIKNVSYITGEGAECFKVTITVDNPGSLTKGLEATATITSGGTVMSPSDAGTLDYYQTKTITAGVNGTISLQNLEESLKVSSVHCSPLLTTTTTAAR